MVGTHFLVFGKWDPMEHYSGDTILDEMWSFDGTTQAWSEENAQLPYPVPRHAAVTVAVGANAMTIVRTDKGVLTCRDGVLQYQRRRVGRRGFSPQQNNGAADTRAVICCSSLALASWAQWWA